jgi:hypothetical protein
MISAGLTGADQESEQEEGNVERTLPGMDLTPVCRMVRKCNLDVFGVERPSKNRI